MRVFVKITGLLTGVLVLWLSHCLLVLIPPKYSVWIRTRLLQALAKLSLRLLGVKVEPDPELSLIPHKTHRSGTLILGNHLSYLDPLVICSMQPSLFVTSTEMRDKKGLGFFCKIADCLFVNRRKIWGLPEEISAIAKILEQGGNVTVFPEATTSAGCSILPFKSSLIQAAVNAGAAVQTYAIRFDKVKGRVCDSEDRNLYCWYGDMDFTPHFLKLLKLKNLELSIKSVCYEGLTLCRKTTTRNSFEAVKKWTSDRRVYTHLDSNQKWNWVSAFVPFLGLKGFVRRR